MASGRWVGWCRGGEGGWDAEEGEGRGSLNGLIGRMMLGKENAVQLVVARPGAVKPPVCVEEGEK